MAAFNSLARIEALVAAIVARKWTFDETNNARGQIEGLFFAHPSSIELPRSYLEVKPTGQT